MATTGIPDDGDGAVGGLFRPRHRPKIATTKGEHGREGVRAVVHAQTCDEFAETGQRICGLFRDYWHEHGGLAQQGYPLTPIFVEQSATNGQSYRVQYFERAVLECHPELPEGQRVLLSQLGRQQLAIRHPHGPPALDSAFLAVGPITMNASGALLEWTIPVTNVSERLLLAVTISVDFSGADGQPLDRSLAAAVNIEPGQTRTLKGISIKGLNFASYRILPPDVTV